MVERERPAGLRSASRVSTRAATRSSSRASATTSASTGAVRGAQGPLRQGRVRQLPAHQARCLGDRQGRRQAPSTARPTVLSGARVDGCPQRPGCRAGLGDARRSGGGLTRSTGQLARRRAACKIVVGPGPVHGRTSARTPATCKSYVQHDVWRRSVQTGKQTGRRATTLARDGCRPQDDPRQTARAVRAPPLADHHVVVAPEGAHRGDQARVVEGHRVDRRQRVGLVARRG